MLMSMKPLTPCLSEVLHLNFEDKMFILSYLIDYDFSFIDDLIKEDRLYNDIIDSEHLERYNFINDTGVPIPFKILSKLIHMIAMQFGKFPLSGFFLTNKRKELCEAVKDIYITKMNLCVCNNCPIFQNDMTIFSCGPLVDLTEAIKVSDLKYDEFQDKFLIEKLSLMYDNFQNLTFNYHIDEMLNEEIVSRCEFPREWIQDFIIWTTSICNNLNKNYRVIPSACGCNGCEKITDIYWEEVNNIGHVTKLPSDFYCASITYEKCKVKYKSDIQWLSHFIYNVETLSVDENEENSLFKFQIPRNAIRIKKLLNDFKIDKDDISLLFKRYPSKNYFNSKYGKKNMIVFVKIYKKLSKEVNVIKIHWDEYKNSNAENRALKWLKENPEIDVGAFHTQSEIDAILDQLCIDYMSVPNYVYIEKLNDFEKPKEGFELATEAQLLMEDIDTCFKCIADQIESIKPVYKEDSKPSIIARRIRNVEEDKEKFTKEINSFKKRSNYILDPNNSYLSICNNPKMKDEKLVLKHFKSGTLQEPCEYKMPCKKTEDVGKRIKEYKRKLQEKNRESSENLLTKFNEKPKKIKKYLFDLINATKQPFEIEKSKEFLTPEDYQLSIKNESLTIKETPISFSIIQFNKFFKFKLRELINNRLKVSYWSLDPNFNLKPTKKGFVVGVSSDFKDTAIQETLEHIQKNFNAYFDKWLEEFLKTKSDYNLTNFREKCYNFFICKSKKVLQTRKQKSFFLTQSVEELAENYYLSYFNLIAFCSKIKNAMKLQNIHKKYYLKLFKCKEPFIFDS